MSSALWDEHSKIDREGINSIQCSVGGIRAQELCESRGGRPGLSVLMSLLVSVDVQQY